MPKWTAQGRDRFPAVRCRRGHFSAPALLSPDDRACRRGRTVHRVAAVVVALWVDATVETRSVILDLFQAPLEDRVADAWVLKRIQDDEDAAVTHPAPSSREIFSQRRSDRIDNRRDHAANRPAVSQSRYGHGNGEKIPKPQQCIGH